MLDVPKQVAGAVAHALAVDANLAVWVDPLAYGDGVQVSVSMCNRYLSLCDQYLFRGIEINYPMLISPIMMVPRRLPFATLQEEYLRRARDMRIKIGPLNSNAERKKARVPVDKHDYTSRSTLMVSVE